MLAQPAVALHDQYPLGSVPGEPVSPVEQTIIDSFGDFPSIRGQFTPEMPARSATPNR
jgi:hypothetical protein